jgi:hypothetical protein
LFEGAFDEGFWGWVFVNTFYQSVIFLYTLLYTLWACVLGVCWICRVQICLRRGSTTAGAVIVFGVDMSLVISAVGNSSRLSRMFYTGMLLYLFKNVKE